MSYVPGPFEGGPIEAYLHQELQRISEVIIPIADGDMRIRNVAPAKPRNGLYYADGTDWNPGSGKGVYRFDEGTTTFVFLG